MLNGLVQLTLVVSKTYFAEKKQKSLKVDSILDKKLINFPPVI